MHMQLHKVLIINKENMNSDIQLSAVQWCVFVLFFSPLTVREIALLVHADLRRVDQEADGHRPAHGGADPRVARTALVHLQQGQVTRGPARQRHHVVINAICGTARGTRSHRTDAQQEKMLKTWVSNQTSVLKLHFFFFFPYLIRL